MWKPFGFNVIYKWWVNTTSMFFFRLVYRRVSNTASDIFSDSHRENYQHINTHDGSMVLLYIYGVPWIPSIYPKHVSINIPAPWIRHGTYLSTIHIQHLSSATCWWLFFGLYHAIPSIYWGLSQLMGKSLLTENPVRRDAENSDFEHCWHVLFSTRNGKYPKWASVYGNVYLDIVKHINIKINNSQISL